VLFLHDIRDIIVADKARTRLPRTQKGRTFGKRCWAEPEVINGIRNQGSRQQLCLRTERTTINGVRGQSRRQEPSLGSRTTLNKTFRKTVELEFAQQIGRTSIRLENECEDIMEGSAHSRAKKETTNNRLRTVNIGALTILGSFGHINWRKMIVINLDQLAPYEGSAQDERP
jgi:hypothetical protein